MQSSRVPVVHTAVNYVSLMLTTGSSNLIYSCVDFPGFQSGFGVYRGVSDKKWHLVRSIGQPYIIEMRY